MITMLEIKTREEDTYLFEVTDLRENPRTSLNVFIDIPHERWFAYNTPSGINYFLDYLDENGIKAKELKSIKVEL